jgi:hypothetical protein
MSRQTAIAEVIAEPATTRSFSALCYAVVLLSSFLLFEVELIIGKFLLPWFGGVPATWITCLLFFQVVLLLGYTFAHLVNGARPHVQASVHSILIAISLLLLMVTAIHWRTPITPGAAWKPYIIGHPTWQVLKLLAASVGIPFLVLSATAPLLQSWFARVRPTESAYPMYALSNLGSLLALLAYPVIIEPNSTLLIQGWAWAVAYLLFALLCGACAFSLLSAGRLPEKEPTTRSSPTPVPFFTRVLWVGLAACASAMLLAVTNMICQEIAVVPLLWVLPLAAYLITFIACFARRTIYRRWLFHPLFAMVAILTLVLGRRPPTWDIFVYLLLLFAVCMMCHGELVGLKPSPAHLTSFYLSLATGGALGSAFVSLAAPLLFTQLWELPITEVAAAIVVIMVLFRDRESWFYTSPLWLPILLVWAVVLYFRGAAALFHVAVPWGIYNYVMLAAFTLASLWLLRRRRGSSRFSWFRPAPFFALALVGVLTFNSVIQAITIARGSVYSSRNFFGILHVNRDEKTLSLRHGRTLHGIQIIDPRYRDTPTSYYLADSGIGSLLLEERHRLPGHLRVGVVGLGVGTLAAYGRAGDYYRFYEINPDVYKLSSGKAPTFTFLADSPAKVDVQLGDARLLLESEANHGELQNFDVLVLDAFNSDSIPVHLLTQEAIELYLKHLNNPDGVLAVHISNRSLDLAPVLTGIADKFHLESAVVDYRNVRYQASLWVLLSRNRAMLELPLLKEHAQYGPPSSREELWTDDYSNLLRLIKWPQ